MMIVEYKNEIGIVTGEFISGNGTYDMTMYEVKFPNKEKTVILPDIDVKQTDDYITDGIFIYKKCDRKPCGLLVIDGKSRCNCDYLISEHEVFYALQSLDTNIQ